MQDKLMTRREVAEMLGMQPNTLARWAWKKEGPPFIKVGPKAVRYRRSEVMAWLWRRAGIDPAAVVMEG